VLVGDMIHAGNSVRRRRLRNGITVRTARVMPVQRPAAAVRPGRTTMLAERDLGSVLARHTCGGRPPE